MKQSIRQRGSEDWAPANLDQGESLQWTRSTGLLALVLYALLGPGAVNARGDEGWRYFGQQPPGLDPVVFAPDRVSTKEAHEFGSVFSEDGRSFFLGVDLGGRSEIRGARVVDGEWSPLEPVITHSTYSYNDPFLSPDESRLYFISDQPLDGAGAKKDHDIWYAERRVDGWSAPINAGGVINSTKQDYYISFTDDGTMYFSSNRENDGDSGHDFDLYSADFVDGEFHSRVRLPETVNSQSYEADVFVAPDASYLIFVSIRKGGRGRGDLYLSFRDAEGGWSEAKSMGPEINTAGHELCPFVSRDGKYLFFTRDGDIYWVDAAIITGAKGSISQPGKPRKGAARSR